MTAPTEDSPPIVRHVYPAQVVHPDGRVLADALVDVSEQRAYVWVATSVDAHAGVAASVRADDRRHRRRRPRGQQGPRLRVLLAAQPLPAVDTCPVRHLMAELHWFTGIHGDTLLRDIGWTYVLLVAGVFFVMANLVKLWRGW